MNRNNTNVNIDVMIDNNSNVVGIFMKAMVLIYNIEIIYNSCHNNYCNSKMKNEQSKIRKRVKYFIAQTVITFMLIVFLTLHFINEYVLVNFNMKIKEWYLFGLLGINIIISVLTETFHFDDSTGGYDNNLWNMKIFIRLFLFIILYLLYYRNFITNTNFLNILLTINLITTVIFYFVRVHLSKNLLKNSR